MRKFAFQILSPERIVYRGDIVSLVAPGVEGYLGIMAGHAPLLAALSIGEVKVTEENQLPLVFAITGGVLEVDKNGVTVMADAAERAEEIDVTRAEASRERAQQRIVQGDDVDVERAQAAIKRALNRLRTAGRANLG